jgi:hypothetical protein
MLVSKIKKDRSRSQSAFSTKTSLSELLSIKLLFQELKIEKFKKLNNLLKLKKTIFNSIKIAEIFPTFTEKSEKY